jgi:hypothetical protein
VAAVAGIALAHGGTAGLIVEAGAAVAIGVLMVWALWKARKASENDEGGR